MLRKRICNQNSRQSNVNLPSTEYEQKFQSLFTRLIAERTFCLSTPCPASLQSTDVGKSMLTLNTLWAGLAAGGAKSRN